MYYKELDIYMMIPKIKTTDLQVTHSKYSFANLALYNSYQLIFVFLSNYV